MDNERTFFDDLNDPGEGVFGKFYVSERKPDTVYCVASFTRARDSITCLEYDFDGKKRRGARRYCLSDCYDEVRASESFEAIEGEF